MVALLTHPGQLAAVRAGEIGWDAVIDEVLRVHPSIATLPLRFAVSDITVEGITIPAGDAIVTTYAAANHDPAHYGPTAAEFDATRAADDHLAFGIGVHRCIGAPWPGWAAPRSRPSSNASPASGSPSLRKNCGRSRPSSPSAGSGSRCCGPAGRPPAPERVRAAWAGRTGPPRHG